MHNDFKVIPELNPMEAPIPGRDPRPAIIMQNVTKTFDLKYTRSLKETMVALFKRKQISSKFNAVNNISIRVPEGQSVAVMGHNGSGKSTTLKLLSGVMTPDQGWIRTRGRLGGLLEVGAGFHPDLTGRANIYLNAAILGMTKEEIDERFDSIVEFSELKDFIDTEIKFYSSGMHSRLGFAVAIHTELDVLLVDEVLAVGDAQFRSKCYEKIQELREQGKTMFIVNHGSGILRNLCDRGIVLEKGAVIFDGPIAEAIEFKDNMDRSAIEKREAKKKSAAAAKANAAASAALVKEDADETPAVSEAVSQRTGSKDAAAVTEQQAAEQQNADTQKENAQQQQSDEPVIPLSTPRKAMRDKLLQSDS